MRIPQYQMWLGLGFSESERFVWNEEMGKGSQEEAALELGLWTL